MVVVHFDLTVKIFAAYERLAKAAFFIAVAVPQLQVHVAQRGVALVRVDINVKAEVAHAGDVDGLVIAQRQDTVAFVLVGTR